MSKGSDWIVGIDLCGEQTQMSWCSLQGAQSAQIDMIDKESEMVIDPSAYREEGVSYLTGFLKQALDGCGMDGQLACLSLTSPDPEMEADLTEAASALAGEGNCMFLTRPLSYTWYALSQRSELWSHDNGLFEYEGDRLLYTHLDISRNRSAVYVKADRCDLSEYMAQAGRDAASRDQGFAAAVAHISQGKDISTFYLTGKGFADAYDGERWMDASLRELCRSRRHVFVGQNLFARGACLAGYYARNPKNRPVFLAEGMGLSVYDLSLYVSEGGRKVPLTLSSAQQPWRSAQGRVRIISRGADMLELYARNVLTSEEKIFQIPLGQIPGRPVKTLRFEVRAVYVTENVCRILVSDTGFGSLYPSSGKVFEKTIDLQGDGDIRQSSGEILLKEAAPEDGPVLEMSLSGARIASTDELSWYIYENIYMLDEDFFGEDLYDWLDHKTGGKSVSASLRRIAQGGRREADACRAMLTAFDLLDARETAAVCAALSQLQGLDPLEKARIKADGLCRYGNDMEALRLYHHAAWLMDHEEILVNDRLKAVIWHNMGVCLMKLHDPDSAADCMQRAFACVRDRQYLTAYLCVLYMAGRENEMSRAAQDAGFPQEADQALTLCRSAARSYESSGRGLGMRAGISLKDMPGQPGYREFVQEYIQSQCRRYGVRVPGESLLTGEFRGAE